MFESKELEAKKRALAAESDVYRETLRLELHNLRLYGISVKRKLSVFQAFGPILLAIAPIARMVVRRRTDAKLGLFGKMLKGWQLYRKLSPAIAVMLAGLARGRMRHSPTQDSLESEPLA